MKNPARNDVHPLLNTDASDLSERLVVGGHWAMGKGWGGGGFAEADMAGGPERRIIGSQWGGRIMSYLLPSMDWVVPFALPRCELSWIPSKQCVPSS